jgi:hypothetical protein
MRADEEFNLNKQLARIDRIHELRLVDLTERLVVKDESQRIEKR